MIYRTKVSTKDRRLLKGLPVSVPTQRLEQRNYKDAIVKKPWGYEYLVFENAHVAIWMLHIARTRMTSMHAHVNKKTSLVLFSGTACFADLKGKRMLAPMDSVVIEEGAFHATKAHSALPIEPLCENGIWVMEIESPPVKSDLVRIKDVYGRQGTSYESTEHFVYHPLKCLNLKTPAYGTKPVRERFLDHTLTVVRGDEVMGLFSDGHPGLVCVVSRASSAARVPGALPIGEAMGATDFLARARGLDLAPYLFLVIEKQEMVRVSDYIFNAVADLGVKSVFAVSGGGAMHLVDSLGMNDRLQYVATHHEQAAAMAAEASARVSGRPGVALVTSGPGGTNALTGVCGAWIDSIPTLYISGQVKTDTMIGTSGVRQLGVQESDIIAMVRSVTKYAVTVNDPNTVRYHVEKAVHLATSGRPGPVWLDIPLDVQSVLVEPKRLKGFVPERSPEKADRARLRRAAREAFSLIRRARRPVLISGYGIRLAKGVDVYRELVSFLNIPVVSSWTSSDLLDGDDPLYVGRCGIFGDRASNFAVQNSDLLLVLGSRLSIPQTGYNYHVFARAAKKIMVDIDTKEIHKPSLRIDLPVVGDVRVFMEELLALARKRRPRPAVAWHRRCRDWKRRYPVVLDAYRRAPKFVNSFYFVDELAKRLGRDAIVVTDMGTSFTCTMQTFKTKLGQRLFTSSGHASMGFGLPGAIGACFGAGLKKTVCVSGDGGLQMNIQELQTLAHYKLPVILFVLNNRGYLTIKLMQQNHFGRYVGSDPSSGVSCPDIVKVARAHGIGAERISNNKELLRRLDAVLAQPGPYVCEIVMPPEQPRLFRASHRSRNPTARSSRSRSKICILFLIAGSSRRI
jgi:acetolactate synthase-1/2/3 large subunit